MEMGRDGKIIFIQQQWGRGKEQDGDDKCAHASRYYGLYLLAHYFC